MLSKLKYWLIDISIEWINTLSYLLGTCYFFLNVISSQMNIIGYNYGK